MGSPESGNPIGEQQGDDEKKKLWREKNYAFHIRQDYLKSLRNKELTPEQLRVMAKSISEDEGEAEESFGGTADEDFFNRNVIRAIAMEKLANDFEKDPTIER